MMIGLESLKHKRENRNFERCSLATGLEQPKFAKHIYSRYIIGYTQKGMSVYVHPFQIGKVRYESRKNQV